MKDNFYIALNALFKDILKMDKNIEVILDQKLKSTSYYKDNEININMEEIILKADELALGMYRDTNISDENDSCNVNNMMKSIFTSIKNINSHKHYNPPKLYYKPTILNTSENIFPRNKEEIIEDVDKEYYRLIDALREEIEKIDVKGDIEKTYNVLHYNLEKYTSFIPATNTIETDTSLFDKLRTMSAIATCLYIVEKSQENLDNKFLILEADVSGIQSFIYRITQGEETKKKIAKSLRGRSAYINILIDFMSKYMARELGVTISNILYCGGGKFQLLLPNTLKTKEKLSEIKLDIQKYLYSKYKAQIGLVIETVEVNEEEIKDYSKVLLRLHDKMQEAKNRKFLDIINIEKSGFFVEAKGPKNVCRYCNINERQDGKDICEECETLIALGEKLINDRIKYIVYDFDNSVDCSKADTSLLFKYNDVLKNGDEIATSKEFGRVCFFEELNSYGDAFLVENINNKGRFGRSKFVGNIVPSKDYKKIVASFNDMADVSKGDKKIALLKMDIDNLGTIFSSGIGDKKSIARVSTLSRMIDVFFSGYINEICNEVYEEFKKNNKTDLSQIFYINYAGGDDLLIIGPWDWTVKLALRIKERFNEYVCHNPNITISAGICICDPKNPIRITSEEAENYLEKSKENAGKDSVTVFGQTLKWFEGKSFKKALVDSEEYTAFLQNNTISRSLIFDIMIASKHIDLKVQRSEDFLYVPKIAYSLSRNVKNKKVAYKLSEKLITAKMEDSEIEFIKIPMMMTLMKTRK